MKIRIAKFQGPIDPPRYQEPPQIVQDIPPTHIPKAANAHEVLPGDTFGDYGLPNEDTSNERR